MKAVIKIFNRLEEYLMLLIFPVMVLLVFVATFVRYLNLGSMPWADEGSRYLMICLVFAGISYGFRYNIHLGMSFIVDRIPMPYRTVCIWGRTLLLLAFGGLMSYSTYALIKNQLQFNQKSASLGIPMVTMYIVMLCGCILMVVRILQAAFSTPEMPEDEEVPSI